MRSWTRPIPSRTCRRRIWTSAPMPSSTPWSAACGAIAHEHKHDGRHRAYYAPNMQRACLAIYPGRGIGFFGYFEQPDPFPDWSEAPRLAGRLRNPRKVVVDSVSLGSGRGESADAVCLTPQRLDVVQHRSRMEESRAVDLADESGAIDQEHFEHVRELAPGRPARA